MLGYEKMADPNAPGVMREDTGVHPDKPNGLALKGKLAESWELAPDGRKATFKLREGVMSNWGNPFTAKDVKWTWDRKFNLKGQGLFQTAVLGLHTPDQIKIEGDHAISFNLDKPNPILLKQQCNLANPIYEASNVPKWAARTTPGRYSSSRTTAPDSVPTDSSNWCGASRPCSRRATITGATSRP